MSTSPQIGQVSVVKAHSWIGRAIDLVTRAHFSHVTICISDTHQAEAAPGGTRLVPLDKYQGRQYWSEFDLTPNQSLHCARWAMGHLRIPYDWTDDAAIGIACIANRFMSQRKQRQLMPFWVQRRLSTIKRMQCAKFGDFALTYGAGIKVFDDGRLPGAVFPGSFGKLFASRGWLRDGSSTVPGRHRT